METRTLLQVKIHSLFINEDLKAWSTEKNILVKYYQITYFNHTPVYKEEWVEYRNIGTYKVGLRVDEL